MSFKKFVSILLVLVLIGISAFVFAGCGGKETASTESETSAIGNGTAAGSDLSESAISSLESSGQEFSSDEHNASEMADTQTSYPNTYDSLNNENTSERPLVSRPTQAQRPDRTENATVSEGKKPVNSAASKEQKPAKDQETASGKDKNKGETVVSSDNKNTVQNRPSKAEESSKAENTVTNKESSRQQNTTSEDTYDPSIYFSSKEKIYYGYDPDMYKLGLKNEGNSARIAALMKKASKGGNYKIAVLGGSISAGAGASSIYSSYGNLVCEWWCSNFPESTFEFVCAGFGSTNPEMACYRMEADLLSFNPDFVVVDFTVNTYLDYNVEDTYSTILYKILSQKNSPAVMSIDFTNCDNKKYAMGYYEKSKTVPNSFITKAVKAYDIPAMSYHNYIWNKLDSKALHWRDIGSDYIHPNDNGHMIAANLITAHLQKVRDNLSAYSTKITSPAKPQNTEFLNLGYITNSASGVSCSGGFVANSNSSTSSRGWKYSFTEETSTLTVPVPTNKGVKIFMKFDDGASGNFALKDSTGRVRYISSNQALTPTLVDIGKMEGKITFEPGMNNGGFTIYGVGIYN